MSIQKYRADFARPACANGATEWFARWMGGPSLAKISNCPTPDGRRTVYIRSEPDTFFSIPAAYYHGRRYVRGYVTGTEDGPEFHAMQHCQHVNDYMAHRRA